MQSDNKIFSDLSRLATSAMGGAHSLKTEIEGMMKSFLERKLSQMDLVTREEFNVVKAMAEEARRENANLKEKIDAMVNETTKTEEK